MADHLDPLAKTRLRVVEVQVVHFDLFRAVSRMEPRGG